MLLALRNLRLSFALLVAAATSAAEWSYSQKGPDWLGKIENYAVGSDSGGLGGLLVIRCVGNDTLELALLEPSTGSQIGAAAKLVGVTTRMFVRVDNSPVKSFDNATVEVWNRNAIGVVIEGRTPELLQLVRSIGTAKSKIAVGFNLGYNLVIRTFGTVGSTAAVNSVIKACQFD
jgi:hypothetical protein